ncbi:hypothetical protein HK405_014649, partial [Cladochytrium tenue]
MFRVWRSLSALTLVLAPPFAPDGARVRFSALSNGSHLSDVLSMAPTAEGFELARSTVATVVADNVRFLRTRIDHDPEGEETGIPSIFSSTYRACTYAHVAVEILQSKTSCDFSVFVQLRPLPLRFGWSDIDEYEEELIEPTGVPLHTPPRPAAHAVVYSPSCGVLVTTESPLAGLKLEQYHTKTAHYAVAVWLVTFAELSLTMRQMELSATQSALSKVSVVSLGMMTAIDAYLCMLHFATGGVIPSLFLPLVAAAFFKFVLFSIFEMRYLLDATRARRRTANDAAIGAMYSRFCTYLVVGVFFFYQFGSSSPTIVAVVGFIMYSFWIPQIVSNVRRNSRRAFSPQYVLGTTAARLVLPLYFYACPDNIVAYRETQPLGAAALVAWCAVQVAFLLAQDWFGPRAFLPTW